VKSNNSKISGASNLGFQSPAKEEKKEEKLPPIFSGSKPDYDIEKIFS